MKSRRSNTWYGMFQIRISDTGGDVIYNSSGTPCKLSNNK